MEEKPDLITIGGDISYDNNMASCFKCYDLVLSDLPDKWKEGSMTRLIPTVYAVGNHDYGVNPYSKFPLEFDDHQSIYKLWFPQQKSTQGGVPNEAGRMSYHSHKFGNSITLLSLDTAFETNIEDQREFISQELNGNVPVKLAHYHNPIYPACKKNVNDRNVTASLREYWVPLFDSYGLTSGMENHVHAFKRTIPLKDSKEAPPGEGTIYIGDGSWGALLHNCTPIDSDLMVLQDTINHVWIITIDLVETNTIHFRAIDDEGNELDDFTRDL